ncbi:MAG TPA: PadR family transcriptional regulator [Candidatus Limnocylindrales bacterium]|nr:PadR family transcriptional regulator [Candidatus Limnocylindrales bacterium]
MTSPHAQPSTTTYAILGLLRLRPWTTYELAKQVQRSLGWFWPRAERKLYDEPKKMVAAGLADQRAEMTGARPRTVYSVTAEGRRALRRWLDEAPVPPTLEFEGMIKVFFADGGSLTQLRKTLQSIAETAEARLAELDTKAAELARADTAFSDRAHLNALGLRFHVDNERSVAAWARWAISQTAEWSSTTDPGSWDYRQALVRQHKK